MPRLEEALAGIGLAGASIVGRFGKTRNRVLAIERSGERFVLKLFVSHDHYQREVFALQRLAADPLVPRILDSGTLPEGAPYLLTDLKPGILLGRHFERLAPAVRRRGYAEAAGWLKKVAPVGAEGSQVRLSLLAGLVTRDGDVETALAPIDALVDEELRPRILRSCEAFIAELRASPDKSFTHGDFQPLNLLIGAEGQLTGILDWEYSSSGYRWEDGGKLLRYALVPDVEDALLEAFRREGEHASDCAMRCRTADLLRLCLELCAPGGLHGETLLRIKMVKVLLAVLEGASPEVARKAARAARAVRMRHRGDTVAPR